MAGLLSAMMSSFDSALNSISGVVINDFYRRYLRRDQSGEHCVSVSRLVTLAAGACLLLFAFWQYQHRESTALERIAELHVLVIGPVACFFVLGVFSRRVNTLGAILNPKHIEVSRRFGRPTIITGSGPKAAAPTARALVRELR